MAEDYLPAYSTSDLHGLVDSLLQEKVVNPWHAPIPFPVSRITIDNKVTVVDNPYLCEDILNPSVLKCCKGTTSQVFFCPQTYSPQYAFTKDSTDSFSKLSRDLCKACFDQGFQIISDGSTGKGRANRRFKCQQGKIYNGAKLKNNTETNFRKSSFIDDTRLNSRANGNSLPRRTSTLRPTESSCRCSFEFTIKVSDEGFYIELRTGRDMNHYNHRCVVLLPGKLGLTKRILSEKQLALIDSINASNCTAAVARNAIFGNDKLLLSLDQVLYLRGLKGLQTSRWTPNPHKQQTKEPTDPSDADKLISFITDKDYEVSVLLHTKARLSTTSEEPIDPEGQLVSSISEVNGLIMCRKRILLQIKFSFQMMKKIKTYQNMQKIIDNVLGLTIHKI